MLIFIVVLISFYSIALLRLTLAWNNISINKSEQDSNEKPFFSIVVPIRNEESNILNTLFSISNNTYDKDNYEVIVVNDHSTDASKNNVEDFIKTHPNVSLIDLPENELGKKKAITLAVNKSKGDFILCTDGDCEVSKNWIEAYAQAYKNNQDLKLIFGPVLYESRTFFEKLLRLELTGLVGLGAASASLGFPSMANGANISYTKKVFDEVNGFQGNDEVPSGDDEFLLRKVFNQNPIGVSFLKDQQAIVGTIPPKTFSEVLHQRKRWAGKWKMHNDILSWFAPAFVFLLNLIILISIYKVLMGTEILLIVLLTKVFIDALFLINVNSFFNKKLSFSTFLILQIIYPFYVVFFGIASNFGTFTWKERRF